VISAESFHQTASSTFVRRFPTLRLDHSRSAADLDLGFQTDGID